MTPFFEFSFVLLLFAQPSNGWDQIVTPSFQEIFPNIPGDKVWNLTFQINRQKSTGIAKKYLNKWIDENWPHPSESIVTDSDVVASSETPENTLNYEDGSGDFEDGSEDFEDGSGDFEDGSGDFKDGSGDFEEDNENSGDSEGSEDFENSANHEAFEDVHVSGNNVMSNFEGSGNSENYDFSGDLKEKNNDVVSGDFDYSGNFDNSWDFDSDHFENFEGSSDYDFDLSGDGSGDLEDLFFEKGFGKQIEDSEVTAFSGNPKKLKSAPKDTNSATSSFSTPNAFENSNLKDWEMEKSEPWISNSNQSPPTVHQNFKFEDSDINDTDEFENFLAYSFFKAEQFSPDLHRKFKRAAITNRWEQKWENEWFKHDTTIPPPWERRCLTDKEYARNQALAFLDHRDTLKMYIRYIFKMGQMDGLITKEEAEKMRQIFWKNDKFYKNKFSRAEYGFLTEVVNDHEWNQPASRISSSLKAYAAHWEKFPPIAENLNWDLQEDYLCWYGSRQHR